MLRNTFLKMMALGIVAAWIGPAVTFAQAPSALRNVVEQHAEALVTVKFVLKDPSGTQQQDMERTGLMISPDGLVLCANTKLGGNPLTGSGMTPTEIKVLIGDDTEGLDAEMIGKDGELDLGWVQITEEMPEPAKHLDLSKATEAKVGDPMIAIRKMDKYFDREPLIMSGYVAAKVNKPRELYVPSEDLIREQGLPVFTAEGQPLGFFVVQFPDAEARAAGGGNTRDLLFVLPMSKVQTQTQIAVERWEAEKEEKAALEALEQQAAEMESEEATETETSE